MVRDRVVSPIDTPSAASSSRMHGSSTARGSYAVGYVALLLVAFLLPFDTWRPLVWTIDLSVTSLTILILAVAIPAGITAGSLTKEALRGRTEAIIYISRRRLGLALIGAFLLSSVVSMHLATRSMQGETWLVGVGMGALVWLAVPIWLAEDTRVRVRRLSMAIVAGAVLASVAGLIEIAGGASFDGHLLWFKAGPDMLGPYLRLSATFSSANVAAIYFELALAFGVVGLLSALSKGPTRRWKRYLAWLAVIDVLLVALVLTYSRGALLGLSAEFLAMGIAGRTMWRGRVLAHWREGTVAVASLLVTLAILGNTVAPIEALRFSTQSDQSWYRAAYRSHVPATMMAGRTETIRVIVENRSPLTWTTSTLHSYGLSYHWLRESMAVVRFTNPVTWLSSNLPPGESRDVPAKVTPPSAAGRYLLVWDLIWNGTTWFAPKTGEYHAIPVRVIARRLVSRPKGEKRPGRPHIVRLPDSGTLGREQLWSLAISMFRHKPLFGMGPEGVRANYTAFASRSMPRKPPPHAHNLELEMLADWGIVGGGLFLALIVVLWWPLLQRLWTGKLESLWELAVIGAAAALLGHQLVDYFLNKQSIDLVFWLVSALAATMPLKTSESSWSTEATEPPGR